MGGAVYTKDIEDPANPDATHNIKIRVWPGGTTHRALMETYVLDLYLWMQLLLTLYIPFRSKQ
jgi:hypothetical protein